ncbi:MAG: amidohydrolase family protein, partial [Rhodanobacter sp.]
LSPRQLLGLVTTQAARILRMPSRGSLAPGLPADLVIVEDRAGDEARSLVDIERSQIRAVVRNGVPCIADMDFAEWFAVAGVEAVSVTLDGKPKLLARTLAEPALVALEPGLELIADRNERECDSGIEARSY